jgi:hypothetical protein
MARTTFSGPIVSNNGMTNSGSGSVVNLTAETTLTFAAHAGRTMEINDADGAVTLPTITTGTIGATYRFFVGTDATDLDIKTDGTDKFVGSLAVAVTNGAIKFFIPAATNDVISMNGSTTGGDVHSYVEATALATAEYLVQGILIGSGTVATPFADS